MLFDYCKSFKDDLELNLDPPKQAGKYGKNRQLSGDSKSLNSKISDVSAFTNLAIGRQNYMIDSLNHVQIQLQIITNDVGMGGKDFVLLDELHNIMDVPGSTMDCVRLVHDDILPEKVNCDFKKFKMATNILIQFASAYAEG